jgi:dipeptidyl aminopeptidase/acylaminoacyl peptidase
VIPKRTRCAALLRVVGAIFVLVAGALGPIEAISGKIKVLPGRDELFKPPLHRHARISPTGRYVLVLFGDEMREALRVHDIDHRTERELLLDRNCGPSNGCSIDLLAWADANSLIVSYSEPGFGKSYERVSKSALIRFDPDSTDVSCSTIWFKSKGTVVDVLPSQDDAILFRSSSEPNSVYRIDPRLLEARTRSWREKMEVDDPTSPRRVASLEENVLSWIPDRRGEIRAAMTLSGDPARLAYWFRSSVEAEWKIVREESDADRFNDLVLLGFTRDGKQRLVASALERDRYGLYEYDPLANEVTRLVYEHPTAELVDLLYDYRGQDLLAAIYIEEGERRYAYMGIHDDEFLTRLEQAFPDHVVEITGLSRDLRHVSLLVTAPDDPGAYWAFDLDTGEKLEIGRIRPWLDENLLATSRSFRVRSSGELEVEAFLTLPPIDIEKPPLVVMPHGGPIGITDTRSFHPEIQYLARSGFAILQVNYRGSGGYGRGFQEAGHRQWGRGIEDDIESAVRHAIDRNWVDPNRMCTVGASYGGYSALMLVIRNPDRYRCAASLNGVTDIALLFNADEIFGGEAVVEQMEELVGSPVEDYDEHRQYSPVYNADKISIPVYLAHGEWDRRVDLDHMVRMQLALQLERVPLQLYTIPKTGHGFGTRAMSIHYWTTLREFLVSNIGAEPSPD